MTTKIKILLSEEARNNLALKWGFWSPLFFFKKEFDKLSIQFDFIRGFNNQNFDDCDYLFLNSRNFPKKKDFVDIDYLKKIYKKNQNLIWFDMRDSAGTTQFEVMPYVKKYVKKQIYKDLNFYKNKMYGGRYYTNYYSANNQIKDEKEYEQSLLEEKYKNKIFLGWNIGASRFFNFLNYNKFNYYIENLKSFFDKEDHLKILNFHNYENSKREDIFFHMNLNFKRKTVAYQRNQIYEILKKNYLKKINKKRINKKNYYKELIDSKICISAYGWGEVCYRDFESVYCGTPFFTANMDNIITWPNIYYDNETYFSYSLNLEDFLFKLEEILKNKSKRIKVAQNAQLALSDSLKAIKKNYFIEKILDITR